MSYILFGYRSRSGALYTFMFIAEIQRGIKVPESYLYGVDRLIVSERLIGVRDWEVGVRG